MLRRALTFFLAVLLIGGVSSLVYFNSQPTTLRWGPRQELTLPLAWLILGSTVAGASLVFLVLLAREGHWAVRQWRLLRALRAAERAADRRSEARASALAGRHAKARTLLAKTATGPGAVLDDAVDYGEAFLAEGKAGDARTHLEDARREFGDAPSILYALARACRALGDDAGAVAVLDRAIEKLPASAALNELLRDTLVDLGWWARAEAAQQRLVDLRPGDAEEKRQLIEIRMHEAECGDAVERDQALRGVLAMDPSWPAAAAGRADHLLAGGQKRAALRILVRALKRRPAEETLAALDRALADDGVRKVLRVYRRLRRAHPANREVAAHMASQFERFGRQAEADLLRKEIDGAGAA
jgi:predicted Zn-dependent protease/uncharacterized integral membrane protein